MLCTQLKKGDYFVLSETSFWIQHCTVRLLAAHMYTQWLVSMIVDMGNLPIRMKNKISLGFQSPTKPIISIVSLFDMLKYTFTNICLRL